VKGTLALLIIAKKAGLVPEVKPVMDKMIEAGFRISVTLYEDILEIVNE
jgi:predicted nucleic acid-binding protein